MRLGVIFKWAAKRKQVDMSLVVNLQMGKAKFVVAAMIAVAVSGGAWQATHPAGDAQPASASDSPALVQQIAPNVPFSNSGSVQNSPGQPPRISEQEVERYESAIALQRDLASNWRADACEEAGPKIVSLLEQSDGSPVWFWTVDLAERCLAMMDIGRREEFVEHLRSSDAIKDPRFLSALAGMEWGNGNVEAALAHWQLAADVEGSATAYLSAGKAKLAAVVTGATGSDGDVQSRRLREAEQDLEKAVTLAGENPDPNLLQALAETKVRLGKSREAVEWAEKLLARIQEGGTSINEQFNVVNFYFKAGEVYYRAGQRDTGRAYMDHAISLATPEARESWVLSKKLVLAGR